MTYQSIQKKGKLPADVNTNVTVSSCSCMCRPSHISPPDKVAHSVSLSKMGKVCFDMSHLQKKQYSLYPNKLHCFEHIHVTVQISILHNYSNHETCQSNLFGQIRAVDLSFSRCLAWVWFVSLGWATEQLCLHHVPKSHQIVDIQSQLSRWLPRSLFWQLVMLIKINICRENRCRRQYLPSRQ